MNILVLAYDYAEYLDKRSGVPSRKIWFMGGSVANHSQIIEALQPELVVWLRPALREYGPGWFDNAKKGKLVLDLFSVIADFIGKSIFFLLLCFVSTHPYRKHKWKRGTDLRAWANEVCGGIVGLQAEALVGDEE